MDVPIINTVCISSLLLNRYCACLSVSNWLGCGFDCPPLSSAEVKERVELYLHYLWAFLVCVSVNFTFTFYLLLSCLFGDLGGVVVKVLRY
jgi:hypothetical protein